MSLMDCDFVKLCTLSSDLISDANRDTLKVVLALNLSHKRVNKVTTINHGKVIAENRIDYDILLMLETTFTVHHTILPLTDVDMSGSVSSISWPHEHTVAVLYAILHSTSVLACIAEDHVTFTCLLVLLPVTGIFTLTVTINLNSESVSYRLQMQFQLRVDFQDVFNQKITRPPSLSEASRHL
jgi:hypothetical protein